MRKLKIIEHTSLDGVIQNSNEDPFEAVGPDIVEGVRRIKSQVGPDLIVSASFTLTSTLLEHGLADELVLAVYPIAGALKIA